MACYLGFAPVEAEHGYYFVSYNSEDATRIESLVKGLHEAGVPLWYDYALEYGKEWKKQIARKINGSDAVLLFLTQGVVEKEKSFVREEYDMATEFFDKKVYVVMLDKIRNGDIPVDSVPWYIEVIKNHVIDLSRVTDTGGQVAEICTALGFKPRQAEQPKKDPEVASRPVSYPSLAKSRKQEPYAFMLYAHPNAKQVTALSDAMRVAGFRVWQDTELRAGDDWTSQIMESLSGASCCIVCVTKAFLESNWCKKELGYALKKGIPLVPIYMEEAYLPVGLHMQLGTVVGIPYDPLNTEASLVEQLSRMAVLDACRS